MIKCCNSLISRLNNFNEILAATISLGKKKSAESSVLIDQMIITSKEDLYVYKCFGFYNTIGNLLAQKCYLLDENILHCSASVERLDTEILILKIRHPEPHKLLADAIKSCCGDLVKVKEFFE
jgi:hypothetical protein